LLCKIGAIALFDCLPYCNLRTLNLLGNGLTDDCCSSLSNSLIANALIEQLLLGKNEITDFGIHLIAKSLEKNVFLQAIDLSCNKIGDSGMNSLLLCLTSNHTLSTLATYQNLSIDDRAEKIVNLRLY